VDPRDLGQTFGDATELSDCVSAIVLDRLILFLDLDLDLVVGRAGCTHDVEGQSQVWVSPAASVRKSGRELSISVNDPSALILRTEKLPGLKKSMRSPLAFVQMDEYEEGAPGTRNLSGAPPISPLNGEAQ